MIANLYLSPQVRASHDALRQEDVLAAACEGISLHLQRGVECGRGMEKTGVVSGMVGGFCKGAILSVRTYSGLDEDEALATLFPITSAAEQDKPPL